ncbi:MAG TPA: hypothetical protein VFQ27_10460 [Xanthobacteraceae bacterium]|nr:hypothetical protein [Xanthobacteraceae bacterium]
MTTGLPPTPDFDAIEAAAPRSADRRTRLLALIGNLAFCWSNNESLLIYVLMVLLRTDQESAAIVFATLNTTRARIDLIQRLAKLHVKDRNLYRTLTQLIDRFNECTRVRNEFNHCMYTVNSHGEITHTQSMRIGETRAGLRFGDIKPVDAERIEQIGQTIQELTKINRDIWALLPLLQKHLQRPQAPATGEPPPAQ